MGRVISIRAFVRQSPSHIRMLFTFACFSASTRLFGFRASGHQKRTPSGGVGFRLFWKKEACQVIFCAVWHAEGARRALSCHDMPHFSFHCVLFRHQQGEIAANSCQTASFSASEASFFQNTPPMPRSAGSARRPRAIEPQPRRCAPELRHAQKHRPRPRTPHHDDTDCFNASTNRRAVSSSTNSSL